MLGKNAIVKNYTYCGLITDLGLIQALPMCPINRTLMRCHLYVLIASLYCTSCCTFFPNIFITEFYLICTRLEKINITSLLEEMVIIPIQTTNGRTTSYPIAALC